VNDAKANQRSAEMQVDAARSALESLQGQNGMLHAQNLILQQALHCEKRQKWILVSIGLAGAISCLGARFGTWWWKRRPEEISAWKIAAQSMIRSLWDESRKHFQTILTKLGYDSFRAPFGQLGSEFGLHVYNDVSDEEVFRFVRIQCTGVTAENITIEVIHNGCIVCIDRSSSPGLPAKYWKGYIQFPLTEEETFEFKEGQMQLELGVLQLAFQAIRPQSGNVRRIVRLQPSSIATLDSAIHVTGQESYATIDSFVHIEASILDNSS